MYYEVLTQVRGVLKNIKKALKIRAFMVAPRARLELATLRLTAECSTIELSRNKQYFIKTRSKITLTPLFVKASIAQITG